MTSAFKNRNLFLLPDLYPEDVNGLVFLLLKFSPKNFNKKGFCKFLSCSFMLLELLGRTDDPLYWP